jgi:hypothetical protein
MKCEEFEAIGLGDERDTSLSELERVAAREHAGACSRCAGLQDSWEAARVELQMFADATAEAETPARVEMRLRHEFRMQHRTVKTRRTAVIAAWALAAAALVVGAVSWRNWRMSVQDNAAGHAQTSQNAGNLSNGNETAGTNGETSLPGVSGTQHSNAAETAGAETLVADNDTNDFTLLPGVLQSEVDDAAILRVRMQRGALGALGLPVNEDRVGEWIQVDMLVANDGFPQAVRLPQ